MDTRLPPASSDNALPENDSKSIWHSLWLNDTWGSFALMAIAFSICHGTVTTALVYATGLLGNSANYGNAVLNIGVLVSGLFLGVPVCYNQGVKFGLILGLGMYSLYMFFFAVALSLKTENSSGAAEITFIVASLIGGIGAGVLWTAQGGYFGRTVTMYTTETNRPRQDVTNELAGQFAIIYLGVEFVAKGAWSLMQAAGASDWILGVVYTVLCVVATIMMFRPNDIALEAMTKEQSVCTKVSDAMRLWPDPVLWLLSPMNVLFGFASAYMNGYANAVYAKHQTGTWSIGLLCAITVFFAAVTVPLYKMLARATSKFIVLTLGSFFFFAIAMCTVAFGCCNHWGWAIVVLYIFQGLGRAVYESTNKACFSDYFKGDDTEAAFANCFFQYSAATSLQFFMNSFLTGNALAGTILGIAVASPFVYFFAFRYKPKEVDEEGLLLPSSDGKIA